MPALWWRTGLYLWCVSNNQQHFILCCKWTRSVSRWYLYLLCVTDWWLGRKKENQWSSCIWYTRRKMEITQHLRFSGGWRYLLAYNVFDTPRHDLQHSSKLMVETATYTWSYEHLATCLLGLSSHTANLLANGDILLVGREGSLRMQRRSGQAYLLRGDLKTGCLFWHYAMGY